MTDCVVTLTSRQAIMSVRIDSENGNKLECAEKAREKLKEIIGQIDSIKWQIDAIKVPKLEDDSH